MMASKIETASKRETASKTAWRMAEPKTSTMADQIASKTASTSEMASKTEPKTAGNNADTSD